jgi:hypothetical protein
MCLSEANELKFTVYPRERQTDRQTERENIC